MYNFSGILYRMFSTFGLMFIMAIIIILFEKPWSKSFQFNKNCKFAIVAIIIAVASVIFYISLIVSPNVMSYTGEYIESNRTSSYSSILPFNDKYVFWNGEGLKPVFYLDIFSKKEICPNGFEEGNRYTVFYEEETKIIVGIKEQSDQGQSEDGSSVLD